MNILIQGPPGIGKTTAIIKIANLLTNPAGFYTEEIRDKNKRRVGFEIKDFEGEKGDLAHRDYKSPYRIGKYGVNIQEFEKIAIPAIQKGIREGKILLVDEIGKMEVFSDKFKREIIKALDSPTHVIATIPQKITPEIEKILQGRDFRIIEITRENRDKLPLVVLNLLKIKSSLYNKNYK